MKVLGIETSCDETGVAIYDTEKGLLAEKLHSQVEMHAEHGGVVPELASRDHVRYLLPLVRKTLDEAQLSSADIDGIAVTRGPGLIGALLVGYTFAKSLSFAWGCPLIGVHHLEGHLLAPMLEENPPEFPFIALLVSGGHTQLIHAKAIGDYQLLGETLDDAAGEAFDKGAKLMGLGYPGGPEIARHAESGSPTAFDFPRPMYTRPELNFSFSGLKTAMRTQYQALPQPVSQKQVADLAASYQQAIVDSLVRKVTQAFKQTDEKKLIIAGGVGANRCLREALSTLGKTKGIDVHYPALKWCTDNGAMIALAGALRLAAGEQEPAGSKPLARWPLINLSAPQKAIAC